MSLAVSILVLVLPVAAMSITSDLCLICLFHSNYNLFGIVFPVKGYCQHLHPKTVSKPHFSISKFWFFFNVVATVFMTFAAFSSFFYLPKICREMSSCLIFVADEFFSISSISFNLIMFGKLNIGKDELNSWLFIFENRERYGLKEIISRKGVKQVKLLRYVTIALLYVLILATVVLHFQQSYDELPFSHLRQFTIVGCYAIQSFGLLEASQKIKFIGLLLEALQDSIRRICRERTTSGRVVDVAFLTKSFYLIDIINKTIKLMMTYMSQICQIWLITSVASLILNIYILIEYHNYNMITLGALQVRTGATIWGIVLLMTEAEHKLNRRVSAFTFFFNSLPSK